MLALSLAGWLVAGAASAAPFEMAASDAIAPVPHADSHASKAPLLGGAEWAAFRDAFVRPDGRVVDRENSGQTHSEGQGYGMVLAVAAGDRSAFDAIWSFARRELQVRRSDSLLAWRWHEDERPHVTDRNNATDGDILVAYGLLLAAVEWGDRRYAMAADPIINDIGRKLVRHVDGVPVLLPAEYGFEQKSGNPGPVVNLSYYIYPAFSLFAAVRPEHDWAGLARAGRALTAAAAAASGGHVPDWVSVGEGTIVPARGFAKKSSYDAVRIPLYMAMDGEKGAALASFDGVWNRAGRGEPVAFDLARKAPMERMGDPGYRIIASLAACATRGQPIPTSLGAFGPTTYFASSLHLLGLVAARQNYAGCLDASLATIEIGSRVNTVAAAPAVLPVAPAVMIAPVAPANAPAFRVPPMPKVSYTGPRLSPARDIVRP